jgi:hypothetical protein
MRTHHYPLTLPLAALALAFLVALFLLAACGTGTGSPSQATATAVATVAKATVTTIATPAEGKATPVTAASSAPAPATSGGFDCASVTQLPSSECEALVALYESTTGPGWVDNRGWLATNRPCSWTGITCTGEHVSHLSLSYNGLRGPLPPALGDLARLQEIALGTNQLSGPIPAELGNLSELVSLYLWDNQLTGPLPVEMEHLNRLRNLSLAHNQLSGPIPPWLGKITGLESLDLSYNQFSGAIPAQLGELDHLGVLDLSHNQISGAIPDTFAYLSKLYELDLSYNVLRGSVPGFMAGIDQQRLWGNRLEGTIAGDGQAPLTVDYKGIHFTADASLATSIWPEVKPATPLPDVLDGPSYWLAMPEQVRFTFADPDLPPERRRMGYNLAAEAQILVFPLAKLADLSPLIPTEIETLRNLLAETGTAPAGELPLLPLTNSAQVFHAQVQYLDFGNIQGLRFISQHSQDPQPIMLSQELFYTFQGFTDDDMYYVAAFFPLTTPALPDKIEVEDWDAFHANYDSYLSETTAALDQLSPAEFAPDLTLLDAVVASLRIEPDSASSWAEAAGSAGAAVTKAEPLATAAYFTVAGWSADSRWLAYWVSADADVAAQQPATMPGGALNFVDAPTGEICVAEAIHTLTAREAAVYWQPGNQVVVVMPDGAFSGRPCRPFTPSPDFAPPVTTPVVDPALSPGGRYRAHSTEAGNEDGTLAVTTTLVDVQSDADVATLTWQHRGGLGELGLGGMWITPSQFLIFETVAEGPLIVDVENGVIPVLTGLPGLSLTPPEAVEGYSLRAMAVPGDEPDAFSLVIFGVGAEAAFPPVVLYHAATGLAEMLPFRYVWGFSPANDWLLMVENVTSGGYQSGYDIWGRRLADIGGEWQLVAPSADYLAWSQDSAEMAFIQDETRVVWQTFPALETVRQWQIGSYWVSPISFSPDGRFLVVQGNLPGFWQYALFLLEH